MRYHVSFEIGVASQQQAVSLRDRARTWLEEQGATVSSWNASRADPSWRVYGAQIANGQITAMAGTFVAADFADAARDALAAFGGTTAKVIHVEQI
jgi:hypothetical protein